MMKRVVLFLLFPFILPGNGLYAQKIYFGVQAGFDVSRIYVQNSKEYSDLKVYHPFKSFNVNGFLSFRSNSFLGLSIEPGFIKKGGIRKELMLRSETMIYAPMDVKFFSNILQIPVFLDFYPTDRFSISIGPELDFILNSKVKSEIVSFNSTENIDKLELSGGVRITYSLIKHIDVGILYNRSITSFSYLVWTDDFFAPIAESKEFNQYIQFFLRFKI